MSNDPVATPVAERVASLKALPLLSGASEEDLNRIATKASEQRFKAGQVLVQEGSVGNDVFFILSGSCEVRRQVAGKDKVLATLGPGKFFGEMAVLSPDPRTATVVAAGPVTVLLVSAWEFREALHASPAMGYQVAKLLAGRLRKAEEELEKLRGAKR